MGGTKTIYMHFNPPFKIGDIIQTYNNASPQIEKVAKGQFIAVEKPIKELPVKEGFGWRKINII